MAATLVQAQEPLRGRSKGTLMHRMTTIRLASLLILGLSILFSAAPSLARIAGQFGVTVSITTPPPDLPVYDQPPCPGENYIWVPGYWAWDADDVDYYWVPGTWVLAPQLGFLWTPGYWSWNGASFIWNNGYWAPVVGFYGGVDYGFGYFGNGYVGGHWDHDRFYYNREVNNVNVTIVHNVYNERVERFTENRVSYDGGNGGLRARPTAQEEAAARERHVPPVTVQRQQMRDARSNRELWASVNHGRPPIAATPKPSEFQGNNVVAAREAGTVHGNPIARENRNAAPAKPVNPGNPQNRANPGKRPNPENRTYNQPQPRGVQPDRNGSEPTPPPNTPANPRYQPQQPQAQPQGSPRMNGQSANRERQQQQMQQREQQQREQQQIRNRPSEQPAAQPEAPRQEQRPQAAPQHETRPPASSPAPRGNDKEKKSDER
jgi:hypothetical protein